MKKGEVLTDYGKMTSNMRVENLAGAVFEVYAAEDIYTADFQKDDQETVFWNMQRYFSGRAYNR